MWKDRLENINLSLDFRAFLILFALAVILFAPFFFNGKVFLAADNLYAFYPWKYYAPQSFRPHNPLLTDPVNAFYAERYNKRLKEGAIDQWNPSILGGISAFGIPGRYYPVKILLNELFPTPIALTLFLFIHVLLMGVFMYYYLSEINADWRGALFGAVAYMFNGCVMVWLEFEMWVTIAACLPLLLVFMERFHTPKRLSYAVAAGIVYGLLFLCGTLQLTIYASVFMLFYLIFMIIRSAQRDEGLGVIASLVTCFFSMCLIGIIIGAVELLPFIELASNSSRINRIFDFQHFFTTLARVPLRWLVTLIYPDYFGSPPLHVNLIPRLASQEYMNYNELTLYAGIPTLFAVTVFLAARKNSYSIFYLFTMLSVFAMIAGTYAYYPFFKLVPGMDKMNPTRLIFLFTFACAVAAGLGITEIDSLSERRKKNYFAASLFILAIVIFIATVGSRPELIRWFNRELFESLDPSKGKGLISSIDILRNLSSPVVIRPLLVSVATFILFAVFVFNGKRRVRHTVFYIMLALLGYDLISYAQNYNTTVPPQVIYRKTPSIDFLLKQPGPFRVLIDAHHGLVNTLIPFGLEEVGGYTSAYPDRINKLMSYIVVGDKIFEGKTFGRWVTFGSRTADFTSRFFDLMNVRYVLTAPTVTTRDKKFKLVFREDMSVYENLQALPRAYVVHGYTVKRDLHEELRYAGSKDFDMRKQVVLEEDPLPEFTAFIHAPPRPEKVTFDLYTSDEIRMSADLSTNGWLVLSDSYYPGWIASVDGKETKIQRANVNFRALELSAGPHHIVFKFRPIWYRAGLATTILATILAVIGFIVFRKSSFVPKKASS